MVRPDEAAIVVRFTLLIEPAGASPVPVSAGAPGSRPQARGEIRVAEAGRRRASHGGSKNAGRNMK